MKDTTIRVLGGDEWGEYRQARLRALKESPEAFAAKFEDEEKADDKLWIDRLQRASRLVAERRGSTEAVGICSLRHSDDLYDGAAEVFGLWITPELRGEGIAAGLIEASAGLAARRRHSQLVYWVGTENSRGLAFASSYGFRPTEHRRPTRVPTSGGVTADEMSVEEIALVLSLLR